VLREDRSSQPNVLPAVLALHYGRENVRFCSQQKFEGIRGHVVPYWSQKWRSFECFYVCTVLSQRVFSKGALLMFSALVIVDAASSGSREAGVKEPCGKFRTIRRPTWITEGRLTFERRRWTAPRVIGPAGDSSDRKDSPHSSWFTTRCKSQRRSTI